MLTPEERVLLFRYCGDHTVARCSSCKRDYKMEEIGTDFSGPRTHLCRICRISLVDEIRSHIEMCTTLRDEIAEAKERARAAREQSRQLQKESQQARDRADALGAEAESLRDEAERLRRQRLNEGQ